MGGRWWGAAVCLLCSWGSAWHGRKGSRRAPTAPFRGWACVPPPQSHGGTGVAWHSLKGGVGGQSRAGLSGSRPWYLCLQQECSALPWWAQPLLLQLPWHLGVVAEWHGVAGSGALPSPASCLL